MVWNSFHACFHISFFDIRPFMMIFIRRVYNNNCCKWPQIEKKMTKIIFNLHLNPIKLHSHKQTKLSIFLPNPSLRPNEVLDCIQVLFQSITRPLDFDDTRIWQKMMKMDDRGNASSFDWLYRNWKPLKTYSPKIPKCIFQNF